MSADIHVVAGGCVWSARLIASAAGHVRHSCGSSEEVTPEERGGRA
jgi:hypothetical protein